MRKKTGPKSGGDVPTTKRASGRDGKVIRDSFTIPGGEYELISRIKRRCMKAGVGPNKSEVLRAGLAALDAMPDRELVRLFQSLAKVKTGRPAVRK